MVQVKLGFKFKHGSSKRPAIFHFCTEITNPASELETLGHSWCHEREKKLNGQWRVGSKPAQSHTVYADCDD